MPNQYESDSLVLVLPLPPSVNDYYGHTAPAKHRVIRYVKTTGKTYQRTVNEYVKRHSFDIQANIPLKVEVLITFKTKHPQDLDNRMKALLDSLTLADVWLDDKLIYDLHIIRSGVSKQGGCIVKIQEFTDD